MKKKKKAQSTAEVEEEENEEKVATKKSKPRKHKADEVSAARPLAHAVRLCAVASNHSHSPPFTPHFTELETGGVRPCRHRSRTGPCRRRTCVHPTGPQVYIKSRVESTPPPRKIRVSVHGALLNGTPFASEYTIDSDAPLFDLYNLLLPTTRSTAPSDSSASALARRRLQPAINSRQTGTWRR